MGQGKGCILKSMNFKKKKKATEVTKWLLSRASPISKAIPVFKKGGGKAQNSSQVNRRYMFACPQSLWARATPTDET